MTKITLQLTTAEAKLLRLALCTISISSTHFVKADTLQREIGRALELHKLAQRNMERMNKA
jgi:hypothetical protein